MAVDLPPQQQERVVCAIVAAAKFDVPADIMLAVAEKEGGKPGQWVKNSNDTFDVGSLQFNTSYLNDLAKFGITADDVAAEGCYPFELAAWRIAGHIKRDTGDLWTKVANYHSRTPEFNYEYRVDLIVKASKWSSWIADHFDTVDPVAVQAGLVKANSDAYQASINRSVANKVNQPARPSTAMLEAYVPRSISVASVRPVEATNE